VGISFRTPSWLTTAATQPIIAPVEKSGLELQWFAARPLSTGDHRFTGVLVGVVNIAQQMGIVFHSVTQSTASSIVLEAVGPDHLLVYSSTMTATTGAGMILEGALTKRVDTPAGADALGSNDHPGTVRYGTGKDDTIAGYAVEPTLGWSVVATEPAGVALASVGTQQTVGIVVLLVGGAVLGAMLALLSLRMTRPIARVSATAQAVAAGDLTARVRPSGSVEVATLGQSFNRMVGRLGGLVTQVQRTSVELAGSAARLSTASIQLASTTTQHSSAATETSSSMEELARVSGQIAETVDHVALQAVETRDKLEKAHEDIRTTGERTRSLIQRVREITSILTLINDIAAQTTLLALNATIEAARAGQAGRGFGVVADEVRRVAERTRGLANDIATIIESADADAKATVLAMEQGAAQLDAAFQLMEEVAEASSQVGRATQQQRSASALVVDAMEQVSVASGQVSTTATEIAAAARSQAELASDLEAAATLRPADPQGLDPREAGRLTDARREPDPGQAV
jgi:methyl-accepting chemotaxis protein